MVLNAFLVEENFMRKELEKKIFEKYPKIFAGRKRPITENLMSFGFECGDGWAWILETLCDALQTWIDKEGTSQVVAAQVKEKFGTLCFYYSGGDKAAQRMIEHAEDISSKVCEFCGEDGDMCKRGSWYKTLCEKCAVDEGYKST